MRKLAPADENPPLTEPGTCAFDPLTNRTPKNRIFPTSKRPSSKCV
jgi:hypothetical protein